MTKNVSRAPSAARSGPSGDPRGESPEERKARRKTLVKEQISIRLPKMLIRRIEDRAIDDCCTRSDVIRRACSYYLKNCKSERNRA